MTDLVTYFVELAKFLGVHCEEIAPADTPAYWLAFAFCGIAVLIMLIFVVLLCSAMFKGLLSAFRRII